MTATVPIRIANDTLSGLPFDMVICHLGTKSSRGPKRGFASVITDAEHLKIELSIGAKSVQNGSNSPLFVQG